MGFQLSNNEEERTMTPDSNEGNTGQMPASQEDSSPKSSDSDFQEEVYPEYDDSPFIADRYQKAEPPTEPSNTGGATILTQNNSFLPILAYIGMGFYIFALIYALVTVSNGVWANGSWFTMIKIIDIGGIFCIIDAIMMVCKKCGGWSLVLWAWLFPPVYLFKRFEANGDSQLIPIIIVGIQVLLVILIGIGSVSGKDKKNAAAGQLYLEFYSVSINGNYYTCSQLIEHNISNPVYKYKAANASEPEYLIVKGDTTVRGYSETIEIRWNYGTMRMVSITLGTDTYSGDSLGDALALLAKNVPSSN